jgi:hypothetical protein
MPRRPTGLLGAGATEEDYLGLLAIDAVRNLQIDHRPCYADPSTDLDYSTKF